MAGSSIQKQRPQDGAACRRRYATLGTRRDQQAPSPVLFRVAAGRGGCTAKQAARCRHCRQPTTASRPSEIPCCSGSWSSVRGSFLFTPCAVWRACPLLGCPTDGSTAWVVGVGRRRGPSGPPLAPRRRGLPGRRPPLRTARGGRRLRRGPETRIVKLVPGHAGAFCKRCPCLCLSRPLRTCAQAFTRTDGPQPLVGCHGRAGEKTRNKRFRHKSEITQGRLQATGMATNGLARRRTHQGGNLAAEKNGRVSASAATFGLIKSVFTSRRPACPGCPAWPRARAGRARAGTTR